MVWWKIAIVLLYYKAFAPALHLRALIETQNFTHFAVNAAITVTSRTRSTMIMR